MFKFLIVVLFPFAAFSQQKNIYKNLVLEGGGVRGLAYAGAFDELQRRGILSQIDKVAGTSAGAIAGVMVCVGY